MHLPENWTIQLVGDSHLGANLPGLSRRANEVRHQELGAAYRAAVSATLTGKCRILLYAGDLWDTSRPAAIDVLKAAGELRTIADNGVPVVVIAGNHDAGVLRTSVWLEHPLVHTAVEPRTIQLTIDGVRVGIAALPFLRQPEAWREAAARLALELADSDVRLLLAHQAFAGAVCGAQNYRFRPGRDVISPEDIPAGFDLVATGHVHRPQILQPTLPGPPIVYAGATDRIAFAERDEEKGHARLSFAGGRPQVRFVRRESRPMKFVPLDITGLSSQKIITLVERSVAALPANCVAEIRLTGQTTRDAVRGLRIGPRAAEMREDALVAVNFRTVQFVANRAARTMGLGGESETPRGNPFDDPALRAAGVTSGVPGTWVGDLPRCAGTYALRDRDGRLVYIGKASNLRQRVRAHLRGDSNFGYFGEWADSVAQIDVRAAASELEASIVEAELVRRFRPAFNRQMREWEDYWYLAPLPGRYRQLTVTRAPETHAHAFGPFGRRTSAGLVLDLVNRAFGCAQCPEDDPVLAQHHRWRKRPAPTRPNMRLLTSQRDAALCERYFAGACAGPCAERVAAEAYERRCDLRDACLRGDLDAALLQEFAVDPPKAGAREPEAGEIAPNDSSADALAWVARRASQLRQARQLLSTTVHLPGGVDGRLAVQVGPRGLRFQWTPRSIDDDPRESFGGVAVEPDGPESREPVDDSPPRTTDPKAWTHVPRELVDPLLVLVRAAALV